jgi:Mce-associated membrane protein
MIDQDERPVTGPDARPEAPAEPSERANPAKSGISRLLPGLGHAARSLPALVGRSVRWARAQAAERPVWAVKVLASVVVAVVVLTGLCWFGAHRQAETAQARIDASNVAKKSVVRLMSYNWHTVDRQVELSQDMITGQFKTDYTDLVRNVIQPQAKDKQAAVQAAILKSSVVSSSPSRVTLLVDLAQDAQKLSDPGGTQTETTLRVVLDKVDGQWLVSDLKSE